MSDTLVVPPAVAVRNLLEDLLGREVTVSPGEPAGSKDLPQATIGAFIDDGQRLVAAMALDLPLAAYAGAALGLLPAGAAEAAIEDGQLAPMLVENVGELFNVLTSLLNREGAPHVRLYQVVPPGQQVAGDVAAHLLALGRRLDLHVDINRYGGGRFWLSLAL